MDEYSLIGSGPWYDASLLPTLEILKDNYKIIQEEVEQNVMPRLSDLYTLNRHVKPIAVRNCNENDIRNSDTQQQSLLDRKSFFFLIFGHVFEHSRCTCPKTFQILDSIPNLRVAFISILAPHTQITLHQGQWNKGLVRCHLGLKIPTINCQIKVGGITRNWKEGELLCFDETSPHQAWNDSDDYRVVLIVDVLRPLSFPMNIVNWIYLELVTLTSKIQQGLSDIRKWERQFHSAKT